MAEKRTILYIEDDAHARNLVRKVLQRDFNVLTAQNGLEGLDILRRHKPDLVLTDLNLPDLAGEVIAARIRAIAGESLPIVAMTAHDEKQVRERALAAGCIGYITKPIDSRTLAATLNDFLHGRAERLDEAGQRRATQEMQAELTKELERTVRKLQEDNAELRNLERAKTAFLTQVSHELRTPLTVLSGYIQILHQLLQSDPNVNPHYAQLAKSAMSGMQRLQAVVNEVMVMARLAANQVNASMAPIVVGAVAREAIEEYVPALERRHLRLETSGDYWEQVIMGDATLLRLAFSNLISNAIKATPDYGEPINFYIGKQSDVLHVRVSDHGVGIHPEQLRLLFKPFYTSIDITRGHTSKTEFMGMGLGIGLTIVARVVEAHNGRVWAESSGYDEQACPGATFHILLPISHA
ncbi:MAG: hybrid sensor histidine kinase/response regulator [Anaerolineae bacterium]|nr:hybrid sensor histidine kinase/response regulator [Anaerolineae bacterium]MDW8300036.1 hybrid sensor histidine kinase/response regulator [Anaerolineae bacterium]